MNPDDFTQNLQQLQNTDPVKFEQTMMLLKAVGAPPEPLMQLFDRLEIPWEKKAIDGTNCIVISWKEFMDGERKLQEEGPILKRLLEDMKDAEPQPNSEPSPPVKHIDTTDEDWLEK